MAEPAMRRSGTDPRWPMTGEAWQALVDELARLRADVAGPAGSGDSAGEVLNLRVVQAARRFDTLAAVLASAERDDEPDRAVIGRRVTLLEPDGDTVTYALVFPGDGDPAQGWISADSPLGAAALGCRPGDSVEVIAPAGSRVVTVLAVD